MATCLTKLLQCYVERYLENVPGHTTLKKMGLSFYVQVGFVATTNLASSYYLFIHNIQTMSCKILPILHEI